MTDTLAERWRAARPKPAGVHLDSGACSRQGFAAIDAAAQHARHEAEVGGYVALEAAAPVLDAGRAAVAALTGLAATDVVYTTGANHALNLLLNSWAGERSVACLPGSTDRTSRSWPSTDFGCHRCPSTSTDGCGSTRRPTRCGVTAQAWCT